jgi:cellulose synthase/poly-beta-1,6-N-acetylglucosamine synthase-like glycosyltransferase
MLPFVSVIIPCRNEAQYLARSLDSVLDNDYPAERMEVILADGMSSDGTREQIGGYMARYSRVRLVDNHARITSTALNRAIEASRGEIIVRVDAHSAISQDYISKAVRYLHSTGAWNVGGVMHTIPDGDGPFAEPIGLVLTHRFGVGNSHFRTSARAGSDQLRWVDTVFGGCWRREVFARLGGFNEQLVRSQDLEFNLRLGRAGGRILLAPDLESRYWARANLLYFIRHNWANGVWAVLPFAFSQGLPVRIRHLVPLAFVATLTLSLLAPVLVSPRLEILPVLVAAPYLVASTAVSWVLGYRTRSIRNALLLPLAFASLHWAYGAGSWWGAVRLAFIFLSRTFSQRPGRASGKPLLALDRKETL